MQSLRRIAHCGIVALALAFSASALPACRNGTTSSLAMPVAVPLRPFDLEFASPTRLAVDRDDRVYVTDPGWGEVVVRAADGSVVAWRQGLGRPLAIAVDGAGRIFVGDDHAGRVTAYDANWSPLFNLGTGVDGTGRQEFGQPGDIAIDPGSGEVFVSDTRAGRVGVYDGATGALLRTIGTPGAAEGELRVPGGLLVDGPELLVADQLNYRVQAFDKATGGFLYCIGNFATSSFVPPGGGPARAFGFAQGLWADRAGRLYVTDAFQGSVLVVDRATGARIGSIGALGDAPGGLRVPTDVVIDGYGRLFVASANGGRVAVFGLDGYGDPLRYAPVVASLAPDTIDRTNPPADARVSLRFPADRLADVEPGSLAVNGLVPVSVGEGNPDARGVPELVVVVDPAALVAQAGPYQSELPVVATGRVAGLDFRVSGLLTLTGVLDADGDGVLDSADACPGTAGAEPVDASGCSIAQLCPCDGPTIGGPWRNHGEYVACVSASARRFRDAAIIATEGLGRWIDTAAESVCGHDGRRAD